MLIAGPIDSLALAALLVFGARLDAQSPSPRGSPFDTARSPTTHACGTIQMGETSLTNPRYLTVVVDSQLVCANHPVDSLASTNASPANTLQALLVDLSAADISEATVLKGVAATALGSCPGVPVLKITTKRRPALAFGLEAALLFGGVLLYLRGRLARSLSTLAFGVVMLRDAGPRLLRPPPPSDRAAASSALIAYAVFAIVIWWLEDRRVVTATA